MASCPTWMGFLTLLGIGIVSFSSLVPTAPYSSLAPLMSSYSSGAIYSDLPIPMGTSIRGYWRQGKEMLMSNEKIGQLANQANEKVGQVTRTASGRIQEFKEKHVKVSGATR